MTQYTKKFAQKGNAEAQYCLGILCLEYKIDLPLNIIINSRNILDYQKMFIFLIRIKRIEYSQN